MRVVRNVGPLLVAMLTIGMGVASTASATSVGVMAWGANNFGQLGNGTTKDSDEAITLSEPADVVAVAGGEEFSLALLKDGKVMAWGYNNAGQLGDGTETNSDVPVEVKGLSEVIAISAGGQHSLALLEDGKVMAWGGNGWGELGDGTTTASDEPVEVKGLSEVAAISAGYYHSLALLKSGKVMAWGNDEDGELGDGTTTNSDEPVEVGELSEATAISGGRFFSLAVLKDGKVMSWGYNAYGQLGGGSSEGPEKCGSKAPCSVKPVEVKGLSEEVTAVAAGGWHSLAVLKDGKVMSWGLNSRGQLGDGTTTNSDEPVEVGAGLTEVAAVSAGLLDSMALSKSGKVMAWGQNGSGQLGDGTEAGPETCESVACSRTPLAVSKLGKYVAGISAGGNQSLAYASGPIVTKLEPRTGLPIGGETVMISGLNFTGVTAVKFGATEAPHWKVISSTSIEAVAPPGGETVYVTVTDSYGSDPTSNESPGALFRYVTPEAPQFGRCVKVTKGTGKYTSGKCVTGSAAGSYEWTPGITKGHFTLSAGETILETAAKTKIVCKLGTGAGEYHGTKEVDSTVIKLTECESGGAKCTSTGASAGEIVTNSLEGKLGSTGFATETVALDLAPAAGAFAEFSCGATAVVVDGSALANVPTDKMEKERVLKYEVSKGKQTPESFEGMPADVLEMSFAGGSPEKTVLTVNLTQYSEEEVEVDASV